MNDRSPPYDAHAERAVLSSVLMHNESLAAISNWVSAADFYVMAHRLIFEVMTRLQSEERAIDTVTVGSLLDSGGTLTKVGGPMVFSDILDSEGTFANVEHYARIVAEKAAKRRIIHEAQRIVAEGMADKWDTEDFAIEAQRRISDAASSLDGRGDAVRMIGDGIERVAKAAVEGNDPFALVKTGIDTIDRSLGGLWPKELTILAARPGMGKSSLALNIALNAAIAGRRVLLFTLEDGIENFQQRALALHGRIEMSRIRRHAVGQPKQLFETASQLKDLPLGIVETPGLSSAQIYAKAVAHNAKHGDLSTVIVDHLRRVREPGRDRYDRISHAVQKFADATKEQGIPWLVLHQLNRDLEKRDDKRPRSSDLRESGTIEEDARAIWFLYRPWYYDKNQDENEAELIVSKSNHGPVGVLRLWCDLGRMRFASMAGASGRSDPYSGEQGDLLTGNQGDDY